MGRKTFFLAKQQKHLQSTPLAEPIRTVYVLAMCAHFFAMFCWSQKKRLSTRRAGPGPYQEIRLVVGSPGRATGDITFVEDAGVEREGCLACFLGHLVQKGVIDNGVLWCTQCMTSRRSRIGRVGACHGGSAATAWVHLVTKGAIFARKSR